MNPTVLLLPRGQRYWHKIVLKPMGAIYHIISDYPIAVVFNPVDWM